MKKNLNKTIKKNKIIKKIKVFLIKKINFKLLKNWKKEKSFLRSSKVSRMNLKFQFKIRIKNRFYLRSK